MSIYVGDKEIKNLYIGEGWNNYSAMQGPAPDGFHVPLNTEWQGLKTIMDGLSITTSDDWSINLHMPFAGARYYSSASIINKGYHGNYWSSSPSGSEHPDDASYLLMNASEVYANYYNRRTRGFSVRCFKDSYVAPDSNWTVVQGTLGSAGIFWNQSEGLISITDGTTGYTMMDKNLGATTVYNNRDTLSEANCGKYYQWGNNYGFDGIGGNNPTTSSTQVDASDYGPGNYYSSSTFIKENYDWSSVQNNNLRGGVTGVQKKSNVKKIYVGTTKVRPSGQPVSISFSYTGGDQTWTVPYTQEYIITCKGAGSNTSAGGLGQGTIKLTKGTVLKIMVGQSGSSTSSGTYGFGGTSNYSSNRSGGGLSGVFTGSEAITATSSSRALVIGGGAGGGQGSSRAGGMGGGGAGQNGQGSKYGTAGGGGTQTGRNSGGNVGANQFNGGNGSGTYGYGGGGGWWGGNSSIGDGSGDDDKGAGGGSGYVISTASNRVLTQGGGSASGNHGSVTIVSVNQ